MDKHQHSQKILALECAAIVSYGTQLTCPNYLRESSQFGEKKWGEKYIYEKSYFRLNLLIFSI